MKEQEKRLVGLRKELKELVDEQKGGSSSNNNSVEYINEKRMYLRGEIKKYSKYTAIMRKLLNKAADSKKSDVSNQHQGVNGGGGGGKMMMGKPSTSQLSISPSEPPTCASRLSISPSDHLPANSSQVLMTSSNQSINRRTNNHQDASKKQKQQLHQVVQFAPTSSLPNLMPPGTAPSAAGRNYVAQVSGKDDGGNSVRLMELRRSSPLMSRKTKLNSNNSENCNNNNSNNHVVVDGDVSSCEARDVASPLIGRANSRYNRAGCRAGATWRQCSTPRPRDGSREVRHRRYVRCFTLDFRAQKARASNEQRKLLNRHFLLFLLSFLFASKYYFPSLRITTSNPK